MHRSTPKEHNCTFWGLSYSFNYYLVIFVEHRRHAKACLLVPGVFGVNKTTDFIV